MGECFLVTLEHELHTHTVLHSQHEYNVGLTEFIEHWYNRKRRNSTFDVLSPQQYEDQLRQTARAS